MSTLKTPEQVSENLSNFIGPKIQIAAAIRADRIALLREIQRLWRDAMLKEMEN